MTDLDGFWQAVWDYCGIEASVRPTAVLGARTMPGADWFPGARLNYAQHVLRRERPGEDALYYQSETTPLAGLAWPDLGNGVRVLATRLRAMGIRPGDRVASCMPNIPQTVIAMLATTSIGAVWTSCSPDFGWRGVSDRFGQLAPKVLFCVDSYRYGGRDYDRSAEMEQIIALLPGLEQVIHVPGPAGQAITGEPRAQAWDEVMDHPPVSAAEFEFEQVPFGHPLWILFSSGTTGLPKAITHSHGGILIEQLKLQTFHMDLRPGDRLFFHTTTGWMMWNFLVSSLLLGVRPLLYDGNPAYPDPGVLWEMAQNAKVTLFGASPAYVDMLSKAGLVPAEKYDLSALEAVMLAGSPVSAECGAWFYRNVKPDLWLCTGSGGTDICSGFVGGMPTLPVYAGEIQARHLGVSAFAFNEAGRARHRPGRRDGDHPADAVDAGLPVERRGRRALPPDVLRRLPRGVAAGRLLQGQRARRLLRARPQRRDPEPVRRPHRHRGDLRRAGVRRGGRGRADRQPGPARRRFLHAAVRHADRGSRPRRRAPPQDRRPAPEPSTRRGTSRTRSSRFPRSRPP